VLGDWYATRFAWRPDVLLLVNESTPVAGPAATRAGRYRAADRIAAAMRTYGADKVMIAAEIKQMATRRIGPTANRSVVGIMNEFTFLADRWRGLGLDELSARLAATPCSPLTAPTAPENAFRHATVR
jgi:hypothetical protein